MGKELCDVTFEMPDLNISWGVWVILPPHGPPKNFEVVSPSPSSFQPTPHVCAPHDQALNPLPVISKAALSSEECWEAGPLLILRMFWYFGPDLRWTIQASGKYRADCEILALLLQGITWACLRASLKALNAFHPAAMPLFPGTGLSVKLLCERKRSREEALTFENLSFTKLYVTIRYVERFCDHSGGFALSHRQPSLKKTTSIWGAG